MDRFRAWRGKIKDQMQRIVQPTGAPTRWQRTVRFAYDLFRVGARQLRYVRASQMAAALSFRTLFGLVPVLVVGTLLVRYFRGSAEWTSRLAALMTNLGLDDIVVSSAGPPDGTGAAEGQVVSEWLLTLFEQVEQLNFAAIGWAGAIVVIYAALGLMVTIENSFNIIYQAPEGRPWPRRLAMYWTVLTFGPLAITLTMYLSAEVRHWMEDQGLWAPLLHGTVSVWHFVVTWLVIFAVYKLVPNTQVSVRPTLIGAGIAAVLVEIGKHTLGAYFRNALSFTHLLGSVGLVPVFMFWLYLMWLIALFGLEVANTLQMLGGRRLEEVDCARQPVGLIEPAAVLAVMEFVADRFATVGSVTTREIAEHTGVPETTVQRLIDRLCEAGFVNRLDRAGTVCLARPPDQINGDELIEIGFHLADESAGRRSSLLDRLREAQRLLAAKTTLSSLAAPSPPPPPPAAR